MQALEPRWIEVNCDGETVPGSKYVGQFLVKPFLTHGERAAAVRLAEKYMIGIETTFDQRSFLTTLAFLKYHIVEVDSKVTWWKEDGLGLSDEAPIYAMAEELKKIQKPEAPTPAPEAPKAEEKKKK